MSITVILQKLKENSLFINWEKDHSSSFLSHFFSQMDGSGNLKGNWEIGFFNPEHEKIVVFLQQDNTFLMKPEDDVFKQKTTKVEELKIQSIQIPFEKAIEKVNETIKEHYEQTHRGDGFVTLQTFQEKTEWNVTFITKTLQFLNIRIDAITGEVNSHKAVSAVEQQ